MRVRCACKKYLVLFVGVLFLGLILFPGTAPACRLYGIMADTLPDGVLEAQLVSDPNSLQALCRQGNIDGWGIGYVPAPGEKPVLIRGAVRASADPNYAKLVQELARTKPHILLAHIRWCTSGCCAHGKDIIEDPHPFSHVQDGKQWIFVHNGGVDVARMQKLIGEDYLKSHPPTGSGIAACGSKVVDSELYFLYLLKNIQAQGGDVTQGISAAISALVQNGEKNSLNFILSDGTRMWAFRRSAHGLINRAIELYMPTTLYYLSDPGYAAVASQYPSEKQGRWVAMQDYDLLIFTAGEYPRKLRIDPRK